MDVTTEGRTASVRPESSMHGIAPYIGKLRPTKAADLVSRFSEPGNLVVDPFCGSGVVPLEAVLAGRNTVCSDISPYAYTLTYGKLTAPHTLETALATFEEAWSEAATRLGTIDLSVVPDWVQAFFHPVTLTEILALAHVLRERNDHFLLACLLGILHHQRPGFLSYPASHLVPYLRDKKFPRDEFPELYEARAIPPRMTDKIKRTYSKHQGAWTPRSFSCYQTDARQLTLHAGTVDTVITSPPYMNALDYGRDNRLRLWFLGVSDHRTVESPKRRNEFEALMGEMMINIRTWLKPGGYCVLVVGDLRGGRTPTINLGTSLSRLALEDIGGFTLTELVNDAIPDIRRSRKEGALTKQEWTVVLRRM